MADAKIVLSAEDRTKAAFESAKSGLAQVNALAGAAGFSLAALGSAATLAGLVNMVRQAANGVDAMNDLKDATGASIENISALEGVALRTGANFDTVSTSLIKFNMALGQTAKPGSDAERVIKAIGLNAKELRDMDPAEALRQTAVALNQFADDGNKARAVQELFGKSLKEVAPFLKDLAESGELVARRTTEQAEAAEKFNKELFQMHAGLVDVSRDLAGPVITGMNSLIERFKQGKADGDSFLTTMLKIGAVNLNPADQLVSLVSNFLPGGRKPGAQVAEPFEAGFVGSQATLKLGPSAEELSAQKRAAEALRKELEEQAKLLAELSGLSGSFAEDWSRLNALFKAGKINLEQLELAQATLLSKQPAFIKNQKEIDESSKALGERWKDEKKAIDDLYESRQRVFDQVERAAQSGRDMLDELQFEATLIGKTNEERTVAIALRQLEKTGIDQTTLAYQKLRGEIELQARSNVLAQAGVDAAQKVKDEWERTNQQISDSFVDNLMRGGKSVAQYLKDLFRTLVLRPLLQPIGNMMAGAVNGMMGGGTGAAGGAGGLSSLGSMGTSLAGSAIGGSLMAGFSGASAALAGGSTFGVTGAIGGYSAAIGTGATGLAGAGSSIAAGASAAMAAIPVAGWVALAAVALYSIFGGKGGGPKSEAGYIPTALGGAQVGAFSAGGLDSSTLQRGDVGAAQTISQGISASYEALAKQLGLVNSKLDVGVFYAMDPEGDSQTQLQVVSGNYNRSQRTGGIENVARGEDALKAAIGEETVRVIFEALKASDLSAQYKEWLNAVTGDAGVTEMQAAIDRVAKAGTERQQLEATLFDLTATDLEKLTKVRNAERAAVDESNLALLEQIYAQQDLARAAEVMKVDIPSSILRVVDATQRLATASQDFALLSAKIATDSMQAAVDRAQQKVVDARGAVIDAYNRESAALTSTIEKFSALADTLRGARLAIDSGSQGGLSGRARYLAARNALGGATAENAAGLVSTFLDAALEQAGSQLEYRRQVAGGKGVLSEQEAAARSQVGIAQAQLDTLRGLVGPLTDINSSVLSVRDAISQLYQAQFGAGIAKLNQSTYGMSQADAGAAYDQFYRDEIARRGGDPGMFDRIGESGGDINAYINSLPQYALGTPYVPRTGPAILHAGERVTPANQNRSDATNDALLEELRRARASSDRAAAASEAVESFLRQISPDGQRIDVRVVA